MGLDAQVRHKEGYKEERSSSWTGDSRFTGKVKHVDRKKGKGR